MASIFDRIAAGATRLSHAWNVFVNEDRVVNTRSFNQYGTSYASRPDRRRLSSSNDRSLIASVYTRLSVDTSSVSIRHVRLDDENRYLEDVNDGLNNCLTIEANVDQAATAFTQDIAMTLFEKGVAAIVPVDTTDNPGLTGSYDILTMRVGEVVQWYPRAVKVKLWNDQIGKYQDVTVLKSTTAIVENPFYTVMNEPNSTLQRLLRKLNILDAVDEASSSGKLDIIIQLPYVIKSEARKEQAEQRMKDIEMQLKGSRYGIAYTDGTERITQLNRPAENNLLAQITYLTNMLYGQLGLTEDIFSGKADEATLLNYQNRTINPVLTAIIEAMKRTFLTKTARTQGQSIMYFREPFKNVAAKDMGNVVDQLMRNEVVTANEVRSFFGMPPSRDPKADQLHNANMPDPTGTGGSDPNAQPVTDPPTQDDGLNHSSGQNSDKVNSFLSKVLDK